MGGYLRFDNIAWKGGTESNYLSFSITEVKVRPTSLEIASCVSRDILFKMFTSPGTFLS